MVASYLSLNIKNLGLGNNKAEAHPIIILGKAGNANITLNVKNRNPLTLKSAANGIINQFNTKMKYFTKHSNVKFEL